MIQAGLAMLIYSAVSLMLQWFGPRTHDETWPIATHARRI